MSENTKIEWADATVNFWAGCTKISPACDNCYAEKMAGRLWGVKWGAGKPRAPFVGAADTLGRLDRKAKREGTKPLVFINSMSDLFDNEVDDADRADAFKAMSMCSELTFLVLTKRIGNVARYLERDPKAAELFASGRAWLGATICNQAEADRDIIKLVAIQAKVHFLSVEPMLGPVDLERPRPGPDLDQGGGQMICQPWLIQSGIDWVIVGGESGPGARPMHPEWAISLRNQCRDAGVPYLFKQWGEYVEYEQGLPLRIVDADSAEAEAVIEALGDRAAFVHVDGRVWYDADEIPDGVPARLMVRVGKKVAGRLLEGVEHNGFPVTP